MTIVTSRQIREYYEKYHNVDVTFTNDVNMFFHTAKDQIFLKFQSGQRSCLIYSTSLEEAKIFISLTEDLKRTLEKGPLVALRFCFLKEDNSDVDLSFFVQGRVSALTLYDAARNLYLAQLVYTQYPPGDLIAILGSFLDSNINSFKRRDERINITSASTRQLGLASKNTVIAVGKNTQKGVLRDISFGGMRVIILGSAELFKGKPAAVKIPLARSKPLTLYGRIIRFESVSSKSGLGAIAIQYAEDRVSLEYKMIVNNYLNNEGLKPRIRQKNND